MAAMAQAGRGKSQEPGVSSSFPTSAGAKVPVTSFPAFSGTLAGAGLEMEQPGLEPVAIRDAGVPDISLTRCTTPAAPKFRF